MMLDGKTVVPGVADQLPAESEQERAAQDALNTFTTDGSGYFLEMATRPQTIGDPLFRAVFSLFAKTMRARGGSARAEAVSSASETRLPRASFLPIRPAVPVSARGGGLAASDLRIGIDFVTRPDGELDVYAWNRESLSEVYTATIRLLRIDVHNRANEFRESV